jgi:phosphoribosyl 1,2-cyclic phosphodiesterase
MSLFISSINSGSNGNCYYVGTEREAVLIDAGISCREIKKRMNRLGLDLNKVQAVIVSHEHSDHIRGIETLSRKYSIPVYITPETLKNSGLFIDEVLARPFKAKEPITIGQLVIHPFPKHHDASDPFSFIISCNEVKVGVFTDIGLPCENVIYHFQQCHAAFLEANYDEKMLEEGSYPYYLKQRIRGDKGHLSNKQALELFLSHRSPFMSHLLLSHLSQNNNCPEVVSALFTPHAGTTKIVVASRYEESAVYHIQLSGIKNAIVKEPSVSYSQLQFSFA